jgi:hypothetical protein
MRVSTSTRTGVTEALTASFTARNRSRAEGEAARALVVREKVAEASAQKASRRILVVLRQRGSEAHAELRRAVRHGDRHAFDEAIEALLKLGSDHARADRERRALCAREQTS